MRILIWIVALLPLAWLGYTFKNAIDPIKLLTSTTGIGAIVLLLLSLVPSTCKRLCNLNFIKYRRLIGLFAFFYTLLHVSVFVLLEAEGDIVFLVEKSFQKPFIYIGLIAFLILLFMAITSLPKLFVRFFPYHKAVYIALILATIHSVWAQKVAGIFEYSIIFCGIILLMERLIVRMKK